MKKLLFLFAILFFQAGQAQNVIFTLDSLKGSLNDKEILITNPNIIIGIADTGKLFTIGQNESNEKLGIKFYLVKVTTPDGTYYLPYSQFIFIQKNGSYKESPLPEPDLEPSLHDVSLTKTEMNRTIQQKESTKVGNNRFEIDYTYHIDGRKLDYSGKSAPLAKADTINLLIKQLSIDGSRVNLNKKLVLTESASFQKTEIGSYNSKPVELKYRIRKGTAGAKEILLFISSLQYTGEDGAIRIIDFIKEKNLSTRMITLEIDGVQAKVKCKYKLQVNKAD